MTTMEPNQPDTGEAGPEDDQTMSLWEHLDEPLMSPSVARNLNTPPTRRTDDPYQTRRNPSRQREYPASGPDTFDAIPEDASLYLEAAGVLAATKEAVAGVLGASAVEGVIETTGVAAGPEGGAEASPPGGGRPAIEGAVARGSLPSGENHEAA